MNSAFKLNHPRVFRQLLTAAFTALALHATPLFAITGSNTSPSPTGSPLLQQRPAPSLKPLTEVTKDQSAFSACFLNFRKPNAETTKIKAALKKLNFNIISINSDSLKYGSFDKLCTDIKNQLSSEKRISTAPTCDVLVIDADFDIRFHNALNAPERHATAGMYELLYGKCSGNCPTLLSNVSQVFVVGANTPLTIARPIAKKAFSDNLEKRGYPPDMIESLWSYRLQEISKHKAGQITSATIFQNAFGPTVDLFAVDLGIIDPSSSRQELQLERTLYSAEIRTLKKRIASKRKIRFSEKLFEFFHLTKPEKPAKKISWEKTKLEALIGQMNNPGFLYCEQDFSTTKDAQSACEQFFNDNRLNSSSLKIFDDPLNLEEEIERHRYTRQFGKLNFRRDERLRELKIENRKLPRSMNIYAAMAYSTDFTHSGYVFDRDFWVKHFELNHIKERLTGAPPSLKEADKLCQEFSNISYHLLPSNTAINPEWYQSIGGVLLLTCILDVGPYWASRADILNSPSDDDQITFLAHTIDTSAEATSSLPRSLKLVEKTGCTAYRFIQNGLASKNPDFHAIATKAAVTLYTTISTCSRAGTEHQALVTAFKDILKTTDIGSWSLKEHAIDVYLDQLWASNSLKFIWSDLYDTLTHPENQRFATLERALRLGSWLTDANDLTRLVDDFKAAEPGGSEWRFLAATLQSAAQHNRISEKQKKSLNLNSSTFKKMEKYLDNSIDLFLLACLGNEFDQLPKSTFERLKTRPFTLPIQNANDRYAWAMVTDYSFRSDLFDDVAIASLQATDEKLVFDYDVYDEYQSMVASLLSYSNLDQKHRKKLFLKRLRRLLNDTSSARLSVTIDWLARTLDFAEDEIGKDIRKIMNSAAGIRALEKLRVAELRLSDSAYLLWSNTPAMGKTEYWTKFGFVYLNSLCFDDESSDPDTQNALRAFKKVKFSSPELFANKIIGWLQGYFANGGLRRWLDLGQLRKLQPKVAEVLCLKLANASLVKDITISGCDDEAAP